MFLIDTVTLSELRRRQRNPLIVAWFERQRTTDLFVSVISIGEIERGIARQRATDPVLDYGAWITGLRGITGITDYGDTDYGDSALIDIRSDVGGDASFLAEIEERTKRILRPGKRGLKPTRGGWTNKGD